MLPEHGHTYHVGTYVCARSLGINLHAANHVVLLDASLNPASTRLASHLSSLEARTCHLSCSLVALTCDYLFIQWEYSFQVWPDQTCICLLPSGTSNNGRENI